MALMIDFGIDLGTTNSSIAVCRQGEVRVFQTTDLMNVTPSVVYVSKTGRMLVGKKAYDTWVQDPQNTQAEFKRWIGYNDKLVFPASGKELSAEELSAEVLKSLRADAQRQTGENVRAAVITVPAAFSSLQCEATGRAATMAGFEQSPLLQEPIAAAIAYGASPASRDQRWLVFDFGGGTLDIAVVSTRNSRLAVLEHQGNNRLGGKDIDKLIADALLLAPLAEGYRLPDPKADKQAYSRLMRALVRHAEQAKTALSSAAQVTVEMFDLGDDLDGKPIEASMTLNRSEVEKTIAPIIEQCLDLARKSLEGARLSSADIDRVLLVGGPTQMPVVRSALSSAIGARLDYSLDPMTVVSHGAALYASTLGNSSSSSGGASGGTVAPAAGSTHIELAYERASGSIQSPVAGMLDSKSAVHEVRIDGGGGFWTSGWLAVVDGCFQVEVMLQDAKPVTRFAITARDRKGNAVAVEPTEFTITYMLPMAAPPLPHTMAIEISSIDGVMRFDPIFKRHCPLPAETRKTYKAERTLRPSEIDATLPIKFWEIEVNGDAQEKWWAGCVHIRADQIKRPILEGSELELTIKIDTSRKMSVELFIPLLNQSFNRDVYIPDPTSARSQLQQQLDLCFERLNRLHVELYNADRGDLAPRIAQVQLWAESIAEQCNEDKLRGSSDPDASLGPTDALRKLRMQLTQLEEQLEIGSTTPTLSRRVKGNLRYAERIAFEHGTESEQKEFAKLQEQFDRYSEANDARGMKWVDEQIWELHGLIVEDKRWYWSNRLAALKSPGKRFLNRDEAAKAIQQAETAEERGDLSGLKSAVRRVWGMIPKDSLESAGEQESHSGLRAV